MLAELCSGPISGGGLQQLKMDKKASGTLDDFGGKNVKFVYLRKNRPEPYFSAYFEGEFDFPLYVGQRTDSVDAMRQRRGGLTY
ncbi:MAG: hypothetical protein ABIQ70_08805 [Dokdonella sp.]